MSSRFHTLTIRTPEGVAFALRLASPVARGLAATIDLLITGILQMLIVIGLLATSLLSFDFALAAMMVAGFVLQVGYAMAFEWLWRGQTIGKKALRLRVMDETGLRLRPAQVIVRNLLRVVDMLPGAYLVGIVAALFSRRGQRLGDLAGGTVVVREPVVRQPDLEQLTAGKFNSFRNHPHLEARLRQQVTPAEAGLAAQALLRRDELDAEARVGLFGEMAARFRPLVAFPPEAVEGLSDEQYVRNVVDTVYRRATIGEARGPAGEGVEGAAPPG